MKRLILILLLACSGVLAVTLPPPKWKLVGDKIVNKNNDTVAVAVGTDTLYFVGLSITASGEITLGGAGKTTIDSLTCDSAMITKLFIGATHADSAAATKHYVDIAGGAAYPWTDSTGFIIGWGGVRKQTTNDTVYLSAEIGTSMDSTGGVLNVLGSWLDGVIDTSGVKFADSAAKALADAAGNVITSTYSTTSHDHNSAYLALAAFNDSAAAIIGVKDSSNNTVVSVDNTSITITADVLSAVLGNSITGSEITAQTIESLDIGDNAVTVAQLAPDAVDSNALKAVNTAVDEDIFTFEATTGDFEWHTPAELSLQPLEATLTDIADGTITEDLVNTANPWADNEVADDITSVLGTSIASSEITDGTIDSIDIAANAVRSYHMQWPREAIPLTMVSQPDTARTENAALRWGHVTSDTTWLFTDSIWTADDDSIWITVSGTLPYDFDADTITFWYETTGSIDSVKVYVPKAAAGVVVADSTSVALCNGTAKTTTTLTRVDQVCDYNFQRFEQVVVRMKNKMVDINDRTKVLSVSLVGTRF